MWFFLSLGSAIMAGASDAFAKKALQTNRSETVAWAKPAWGTLFMIPAFLLAAPPTDPHGFWKNVGIALPMELLAALAFNKSIQLAPLSLSIPYLAFTPVFLIIEEWLFFHVQPTMKGIGGVLLVSAGAFLLQMETITWENVFSRRIFPKEKGPLLMLLVSFIFSVTTIFAKRALDASSPLYFSSVYFALIAIGLAFFQFRVPNAPWALIGQPLIFLGLGFAEASGFLVQFFAMDVTESAYVIAIKRLSLLFSVFYGWLFFQEKHVASRFFGASVMAGGAILIALA